MTSSDASHVTFHGRVRWITGNLQDRSHRMRADINCDCHLRSSSGTTPSLERAPRRLAAPIAVDIDLVRWRGSPSSQQFDGSQYHRPTTKRRRMCRPTRNRVVGVPNRFHKHTQPAAKQLDRQLRSDCSIRSAQSRRFPLASRHRTRIFSNPVRHVTFYETGMLPH
jgi:hypothetical protein